MTSFRAPLDDIRFTLRHIADLPSLPGVDMEVLDAALEEAGKLAADVLAPLNRTGDLEGSTVENGVVRTPTGFKEAYAEYRDGGWNAVPFPEAYGGMELPVTFANVCCELWNSANMGFALCPVLNVGAVEAIHAHGTQEQKDLYLPKMISGEWCGTMNLTEPQAGSDVGALTTRATPADDGTWRIKGTKIYISYGEHDYTDNIVHLVLARTPDSPPGTRGISLFIVPKFIPDADGNPGQRNDLRCVSLEHKLGIHASPTAVMSYGDNEGAVGYMLGEENKGMRCMFTMMNNARLAVGIQGLAVAERAYQQAVAYALDRKQGKALRDDGTGAIVSHADVRRMLLTMKAYIDAMRAICYVNAEAIDRARHAEDADERGRFAGLVEMLTPISKAWSTDFGLEVTSLGMQVHGGMGFIEETGAAQHLRDVRITSIYEGTNGIQAMDLVMRKLGLQGGQVFAGLIAEMRGLDEALASAGNDFAVTRANLASAADTVEKTGATILDKLAAEPNAAAAGCTPFLRMMGLAVGGWLLARGALKARDMVEAGEGDADFLKGRIVTARFFCEQLLPQVAGLAPAATASDDLLYAIEAERLSA